MGVVSASVASFAPPASAVTFNLVYRGPGSASPATGAVAPAYDPTGALLMAQMQQAAIEWSDIVEDSHSMTIDVFYAGTDLVPSETANAGTTASVAVGTPFNNRTTHGVIKFFEGRSDWWFDPTPNSSSEFGMEQTLLGSLSSSEQSAGFNLGAGGAPLLEVGHRGVAPFGQPAFQMFDVLSVARHEIGHLMGVTNSGHLLGAGDETSDDDYDFDPVFVGGASVGAKIHTDVEGGVTYSHLEAALPVMSGYGTALGTRFDITATDVFAAAAVGNWTQIDLKRQDYLGANVNFADPANWEGNRVPGPDDFVAIRHRGNVAMATGDIVGSFHLAEASTLATGPHSLLVQADATVGPTVGVGTARLTISDSGAFTADNLHVVEDTVALAGGSLNTPQGDITNDGRIEGHGAIHFDGNLRNNGALEASGGLLTIDEAIPGSGGRVDLDGLFSNNGSVVRAVFGSLDIRATLDGATVGGTANYTGAMTIGAGQSIEVHDGFRLQDGSLTLDGSASQAATFRAPRLVVNRLLVADRLAVVDADIEIIALGDVQVPQSNDTLTFERDASLFGGDITGAGKVVAEGDFALSFGSVDIGELVLNGGSPIGQASVAADLIDATNGELVQNGGSLTFGKMGAKFGQTGGVLRAGEESLLDGTLTQEGGGTLAFDIAGLNDYARLDVSGEVLLDGLIDVSLVGGYVPSGGEQFDVLTTGSLDIKSLALTGPDANRFELIVHGGGVTLEALTLLAGDYNADGLVNAADYTLWRDGDPAADGDGDGTIDADDYNVWATNYGAVAPAASQTAVPEPTAALLVLSALPFARRRPR